MMDDDAQAETRGDDVLARWDAPGPWWGGWVRVGIGLAVTGYLGKLVYIDMAAAGGWPPAFKFFMMLAPVALLLITIAAAVNVVENVTSVVIDRRGITTRSAARRTHTPWAEVAGVLPQRDASGALRHFWLFSHHGRVVLLLGHEAEGFERCFAYIAERFKACTPDELPPLRFARPIHCTAAGLVWPAVALAVLLGFGWSMWGLYQRPHRLEAHGIPGTAEVLDVYPAEQGDHQVLEYRLTDLNDPVHTAKAKLDPAYALTFFPGDRIAVRYVPDDPGNLRLAEGQWVDRSSASSAYLPVVAVIGLFGLLVVHLTRAQCRVLFGGEVKHLIRASQARLDIPRKGL